MHWESYTFTPYRSIKIRLKLAQRNNFEETASGQQSLKKKQFVNLQLVELTRKGKKNKK